VLAEIAKSNRLKISEKDLPCCYDRTIITTTSAYQLPTQTRETILAKPKAYYAKIGHGLKASPEIYYGTPFYLLSAGGIRFGARSQIGIRPLNVILDDDAEDINSCYRNDWHLDHL
jgi:hypothetical protein